MSVGPPTLRIAHVLASGHYTGMTADGGFERPLKSAGRRRRTAPVAWTGAVQMIPVDRARPDDLVRRRAILRRRSGPTTGSRTARSGTPQAPTVSSQGPSKATGSAWPGCCRPRLRRGCRPASTPAGCASSSGNLRWLGSASTRCVGDRGRPTGPDDRCSEATAVAPSGVAPVASISQPVPSTSLPGAGVSDSGCPPGPSSTERGRVRSVIRAVRSVICRCHESGANLSSHRRRAAPTAARVGQPS